jgi:hypothetical protein
LLRYKPATSAAEVPIKWQDHYHDHSKDSHSSKKCNSLGGGVGIKPHQGAKIKAKQ